MALELALRVDNMETAVPKLLSSPTTIGSDRTLPDVRPKRTTRNGGPEPAKRATNPRAVLPQRDLGAEGAPLGAHESTQGTLQPFRLGPATSRTTWLPV